ncbi:MAG: NHLP leader peptide family RiPP precursor [Microbacterium sp.]
MTTIGDVRIKAATDERFRSALLADPRATLTAEGIEVPEGVAIHIAESTPQEVVLSLPPFVGDRIDEEQLADITGGKDLLDYAGYVGRFLVALLAQSGAE